MPYPPLYLATLPQVVKEAPLFGFEQEYTMLQKGSGMVLGWPEGGYPAPQGPFYCGVGTNSVFGRPLAEAHMEACLEAGLTISGINAEVGCEGRGLSRVLPAKTGRGREDVLARAGQGL